MVVFPITVKIKLRYNDSSKDHLDDVQCVKDGIVKTFRTNDASMYEYNFNIEENPHPDLSNGKEVIVSLSSEQSVGHTLSKISNEFTKYIEQKLGNTYNFNTIRIIVEAGNGDSQNFGW